MKPNTGDKMVCINTDGWEESGRWARIKKMFGINIDADGPDEGDIVTVTNVYFDEDRYYTLKEWSVGDDDGYLASQFRPLTAEEETASHEKEIEKEISEALTYKPLTV